MVEELWRRKIVLEARALYRWLEGCRGCSEIEIGSVEGGPFSVYVPWALGMVYRVEEGDTVYLRPRDGAKYVLMVPDADGACEVVFRGRSDG